MKYRISLINVTIKPTDDDECEGFVFTTYAAARTGLIDKLARKKDSSLLRYVRAQKLPHKYDISLSSNGDTA